MKQFLILAVVLCVVLGEDVAKKPHRGNKKFLQICANQSGMSKMDMKTLKEKPMYSLLTAGEQKFICCLADPLIYNGKLVMDGLQKVVSKKVKNVPVNLEVIKSECEKSGAKADDLTTCPKTATFAQCMFAKLRTLVNDHKQVANASANVASNTDTTHNANANKEVAPDTKVDTVAAPTATLDADAVANKDTIGDNKNINLDAIVNENTNSDANAKAKDVPSASIE